MAKLLKHFGIGGKKYNSSNSQQTDYSSASLKSNSVNELASSNTTKYCSNNCLNGTTNLPANTSNRKGPSNSKSDYDTRSLKLRADESNKKQKTLSTEKFKAFGKSSKDSYLNCSKTLKSHLKTKESEPKNKHKNISFSSLINSSDNHTKSFSSETQKLPLPEASSPIVVCLFHSLQINILFLLYYQWLSQMFK